MVELSEGPVQRGNGKGGPTTPTEGEVAKPQKASTAELTVNIQIDTSPECLQRLFDGLNAAVKPDGGYRAQTTDDPMVQTGCEQMVGVEWWLPQHGCDSLENTLDAIKGRILTAVFKWWPTATVSATQPPAEGEVAELVDRLRRASDGASAMGWEQDSWAIARAAELLQRQHPTPVPVSERLPAMVTDGLVDKFCDAAWDGDGALSVRHGIAAVLRHLAALDAIEAEQALIAAQLDELERSA